MTNKIIEKKFNLELTTNKIMDVRGMLNHRATVFRLRACFIILRNNWTLGNFGVPKVW
jgi:hypothetical protein